MTSKVVPFVVALSFFMESVDGTAINTAIPAMAESLNVYPVDLKVALISYLLSLAIFIPISGWLADKYGFKPVFIAALSIFTLSSLWCGFAETLPQLVIARFIQGMGGALGMPVGRLIIVRIFGRKNLINIMSRIVMISAVGLMLGPVIGGFITHYFSWHWIFWINIPFGIFAILMALKFLPYSKPEKVHDLDKIGFVLFGGGLAGFIFGLSSISETTEHSIRSIIIIILSLLLLASYILHSRRKKFPIVKTDLLKKKTFRISVIGNLACRLGFGGIPFLVPLLLQIGLGYPPQISGLLLAPTALGVLLIKPLSLPLLRFFGYKKLLLLNTLFAGLSMGTFVFVEASTSLYIIMFLTFIYGFILSLQYSAMNSLAYADISTENYSAATSIMSTIQQLAQSCGVAVGALLLRFFSHYFTLPLSSTVIFHYAFFTIGLITLLSSVVFVFLKSSDGQEMI